MRTANHSIRKYPVSSSVEKVPNGYKLTANYKIPDDTDCVLVLKNTNTGNSPADIVECGITTICFIQAHSAQHSSSQESGEVGKL